MIDSQVPWPQMPGIEHALTLADVTDELGLGAAAGESPEQLRFKEQFGTLQGSDGTARRGTTF